MKKMERRSGEGPAEKQENLAEKLRRVGKKGGQQTPVASFWRPKELELLASSSSKQFQQDNSGKDCIEETLFPIPRVSARKLAATHWELHHHKLLLAKMHHGAGHQLRRLNHHHQQVYEDKNGGVEPLDPSPNLPGSCSSLRRHVAASLMQHNRKAETSNLDMQPASYGSSMEIAPYNPAITPTSSLEPRVRTGETNHSLRTSTELLKVLNRIWALEEQHVSNMSLVKELKKELDHARSQIKVLVREQQADRQEIDKLMKQITEDKLGRKNKEQDRINSAILSMRDELEDERKLRKRSETLHRKLARELHDVKLALASISIEAEKERRSRSILEDLCDEFAFGIRDYEKELHAIRKNSDEDWSERSDGDQLILHVSESWLDERMQKKSRLQTGGENKSIVEKLRSEIEAFIDAKRKINMISRRNSLESIPLNTAVSAPREDGDEDGSMSCDSNCLGVEKTNGYQKTQGKKKIESSGRAKGASPSSMQVKFEEQMDQAMQNSESEIRVEDTEGKTNGPEKCEVTKWNRSERGRESGGTGRLNSIYMIGNLIRNRHCLLPGNANKEGDKECGLDSPVWRSQASPVRQWTGKLPPSHEVEIGESSLKLGPEMKENTLRAKLFEARTRGQRSQARSKASIIHSGK
ncbi:hypothetical protein OROHE_024670 [Orobanche hederae]